MTGQTFTPTAEQSDVIQHSGSAFVTACPGAGKTRVIVERARTVLASNDGGSIGFLSFTQDAVSELVYRLRRERLLASPVFPHFIGTFDSFVWQFLVAPFGIPGVEAPPRLIPDKNSRSVQSPGGGRSLPLSCFDRVSGTIDAIAARRQAFDVSKSKLWQVKTLETCARNMLSKLRKRGELDFDDAREVALVRIFDPNLSPLLSSALAARFKEIIVDEAQDCNPDDLEIIRWIRDAGIATKVVCDPHQSIYGFRGGVSDQLFAFAATFSEKDRLSMSGNFRSSPSICSALVMLRSADSRGSVDEPLGEFREEKAPVYVLSYAGKSVSAIIGVRFMEIVSQMSIRHDGAPVLAATRDSGYNAVGQPAIKAKKDLTFSLAKAVSDFYFASDWQGQRAAIEEVHKIILGLQGHLSDKSYHQCIQTYGMKPGEWRPQVLHVLRALQYAPEVFSCADEWLRRARDLLAPYLAVGSQSISVKLKRNKDLVGVLRAAPSDKPSAKTIHSVKGLEFPAVCVVATSKALNGILDYLETGRPPDHAEAARKLYVAASRAQRLLVFAIPKRQSARFATHLEKAGASVVVREI